MTYDKRMDAIEKRLPGPVDPALRPKIIDVRPGKVPEEDLELVDPASAFWDPAEIETPRFRFWRRKA